MARPDYYPSDVAFEAAEAKLRAGKRSKSNGAEKTATIDGIEEKPNIRVVAGELGRIVDAAEVALIRANRGLYQRDGAGW